MDLPLGNLSLLPAEILREVCYQMSLEDVVSLADSHPLLSDLVRNVFFRDFRRLEVDWNHKGAELCLFSASNPVRVRSISTRSNFWSDVLDMTANIKSISIKKTEDAKNYEVLDAITKRDYRPRCLEIHLGPGLRDVSIPTIRRGYSMLTEFVAANRKDLRRFLLRTSPTNSVLFESHGPNAPVVFHFSHEYSFDICNMLIKQLIHALLKGRTDMAKVTLHVDCHNAPELSLQTAFQAAIPFEHRAHIQLLRIEFGTSISTLSEAEIKNMLSTYAPYLDGASRLQELIIDMMHCTLDISSLEKQYTTIFEEFISKQRRISLLTAASLPPPTPAPRQLWSNRVLCK